MKYLQGYDHYSNEFDYGIICIISSLILNNFNKRLIQSKAS